MEEINRYAPLCGYNGGSAIIVPYNCDYNGGSAIIVPLQCDYNGGSAIITEDPMVEVYLKCGTLDEYYYILSSSGVDTIKAEDNLALCYQHDNSGTLSAMQALYPGITELASLVTSNCECI